MNVVDALVQTIVDLQAVRASLLAENAQLKAEAEKRSSTPPPEVGPQDDTTGR